MNISLYELIKQKSQEKGRPLKVVCDWDEVIQVNKPLLVFWSCKNKENIDFKNFFEEFWENVGLIKLL